MLIISASYFLVTVPDTNEDAGQFYIEDIENPITV